MRNAKMLNATLPPHRLEWLSTNTWHNGMVNLGENNNDKTI